MAVINKMVSIFSNFVGLRLRRRFLKDSSDDDEALEETAISVSDIGLNIGKEEAFEGDLSCCVCLSRLEGGGGGDTRVLPCLHVFHRVCIDKWFGSCRRTCPVCRFVVVEEEDKIQKRDQEEELTEEMVIWFSSFHVV